MRSFWRVAAIAGLNATFIRATVIATTVMPATRAVHLPPPRHRNSDLPLNADTLPPELRRPSNKTALINLASPLRTHSETVMGTQTQ